MPGGHRELRGRPAGRRWGRPSGAHCPAPRVIRAGRSGPPPSTAARSTTPSSRQVLHERVGSVGGGARRRVHGGRRSHGVRPRSPRTTASRSRSRASSAPTARTARPTCKGEQGQSIVCKATKGAEAFDVKVTVTSVAGDTINFTIERVGGPAAAARRSYTDHAPTTARHRARRRRRRRSTGSRSRRASSPSSRPTASRSTRSAARTWRRRSGRRSGARSKAGADTYGVTVTVTSVQGTDVKFDIQVDKTPITSPSR